MANFLLFKKVLNCQDQHEYERWRQAWDVINRPRYKDLKWSKVQKEVLESIDQNISVEDEFQRREMKRFLYVAGKPGIGKSAVLLESAIAAAKKGMKILIICPTGQLVHSFKAQLPDCDGIENIQIDTIHGVLKYKRPGADGKVYWAPPSALRKVDLILIDEGSQYDDREFVRLYQCIKEQPHSPYTALVADSKQIQPVGSGQKCYNFCMKFDQVERKELDTVYRSKDEAHLLFLNRIREEQPDRARLLEYFGDRYWSSIEYNLKDCVEHGMKMAKKTCRPFTWLTTNNAGSAEVCQAALTHLEITAEELAEGYACDPTSKSTLRIVARKGILLRLTRNLDKTRGFVNGALCEVEYALKGNACFAARLIGTGNFVLVHPMEEKGQRLLPCCYGYVRWQLSGAYFVTHYRPLFSKE